MGFRTVFVKNGDRLSLKLDNLVVFKQGAEIVVPLSDIDTIILEGDYTTITTKVMAKIAKHQVDVIVCDAHFMPCGIYLPMGQYHRSAKRVIWQAQWSELDKANIWTNIVTQKINNQIELVKHFQLPNDRVEVMERLRDNVLLGDANNREGHVAKVYFNSLFGQGFSREDNTFENACLNYGYSILRAQVARIVAANGLTGALGVFHCNEYNAFNLVDDLMEPFRPLLDSYVLTYILCDKNEYLNYDTRLKLIDFLNTQIKMNGKKIYLTQAIGDYIRSFIKVMEKQEFNQMIQIRLLDYLECMK